MSFVWSQVFGRFIFPPQMICLNFFSFLQSLLSFWLQRPTRGRRWNLHSTWRKSPKWRKHWAPDQPPGRRARSSLASLWHSARTGQRGQQQLQSAQGRWNQGKEAPRLRTACWARISTLRWPLSCWWSFQVGCVHFYGSLHACNKAKMLMSIISLRMTHKTVHCNSVIPLNLRRRVNLWSWNVYVLVADTAFRNDFWRHLLCY